MIMQFIHNRDGQAVLLSVMVIGGILIGASAIAGILLTYQIRQTNDVINSTKAFFAADAGTEQQIYNMNNPVPNPTFSNNAAVTSTILISGQSVTVRAQGTAMGAVRALETTFTTTASTTASQATISSFTLSGNAGLSPTPCTDTCTLHTPNPDTTAPINSPTPLTVNWSTKNATLCAGSSTPSVWSTTALSGSTTIDINGQTPPFQFSLSCKDSSGSTAFHTINLYFTTK